VLGDNGDLFRIIALRSNKPSEATKWMSKPSKRKTLTGRTSSVKRPIILAGWSRFAARGQHSLMPRLHLLKHRRVLEGADGLVGKDLN
jgi:hypothetical protein